MTRPPVPQPFTVPFLLDFSPNYPFGPVCAVRPHFRQLEPAAVRRDEGREVEQRKEVGAPASQVDNRQQWSTITMVAATRGLPGRLSRWRRSGHPQVKQVVPHLLNRSSQVQDGQGDGYRTDGNRDAVTEGLAGVFERGIFMERKRVGRRLPAYLSARTAFWRLSSEVVLLPPKRLNRVDFCSPPGRVQPGDDPDTDANGDGDSDPVEGVHHWPVERRDCQISDTDSE